MSGWEQEERFKGMEYIQNVTTRVIPISEDVIRTDAILDDPDHHIEVHLIVSVRDAKILDAGARMAKQPYPNCHLAMDRVKKVIGLEIRKGLYERMGPLVSGREGCVHLFELLMTASRLSANAILGVTVGGKTWETITERDDEFHERLMRRLEGMCIGFNREALEKQD